MVNHAKPEIMKHFWRGNTHHLSSMQTESNTIVRMTMEIVFWNFKSVFLLDFLKSGDLVTTHHRRGSIERLRQAIRPKRPGLLL